MSARDQKPVSDVSAGVGLAGLVGLLAWMAVCRAWPAIGVALGIPGPHMVLDGPNAALVAVLSARVRSSAVAVSAMRGTSG